MANNMSKPAIVLNVYDGIVQDVFCSTPDAQVILVDWDIEDWDRSENGVVEIVDEADRKRHAEIRQYPVFPLKDLFGTDTYKAIEKAGMVKELTGRPRAEIRRYVLYDFDSNDLATTNVYADYQEAVDDASQLDNVMVVALAFEKIACQAPQEEEP